MVITICSKVINYNYFFHYYSLGEAILNEGVPHCSSRSGVHLFVTAVPDGHFVIGSHGIDFLDQGGPVLIQSINIDGSHRLSAGI